MGIEAALVGGGLGLLGSSLSGSAAKSAARTSADAQTEAARIAAEASKFRPVGVTTRFGSSNFGYDSQGNVNSAGYTLSPELASLRETLLERAHGGFQINDTVSRAGQGLFGLGSQYLATSPEEAAQSWMGRQQALLAPSRERQLAGVRTKLFNTGREGLAVGATGTRPDGSAGLGAANPEMEAYYNAIAQQDAGLASQAMAEGRNQTSFGAGLFGTGLGLINDSYSAIKTPLGLASEMESMGQNAMGLGSELGGRASTAGANAGRVLLAGGMGAAQTMQGVNSYSPFGSFLQGMGSNQQFTSGLGNWMNGMFSSPTVNMPVGMTRWDE